MAAVGLRGLHHVVGGVETHCAQLYPGLAAIEPRLAIHVLSRSGYVPRGERRARMGRLSVRALFAPRGGGLEAFVHTPLALVHAALRLRPALVHIHGIGPGFFAPLGRLFGARVVVTHHAPDFQRPKWRGPAHLFLRWGERMAARHADRIICVSAALRDEFLARHPGARDRTVVIRHGTAPAPAETACSARLWRALGVAPGAYLLAAGRIEETKRFDDLIAARARSTTAMPLVIVGDAVTHSGHADALRRRAGPHVIFAGARFGAELTALYDGAAALFHPAAMEGFGLVVLEALGRGVPVMASDIPVHREFGLPADHYFPVGDVARIAAMMDAVPARTAAWPPAASIAGRHSVTRMISDHHALFMELLDEGGDVAAPRHRGE